MQGFRLYGPDNLHPSPEGSYLAALTLVGVLFDRSPVGLPATVRTPDGLLFRLPPGRARLLQDAAAEAIAARRGP